MRYVVITGMSGAGKSLVIKQMEDMGFFCVDNMPPPLMPKFFELLIRGQSKINKVALVIDIRGGELFQDLLPTIKSIQKNGFPLEVLFLEASDETLVKRFKETRRTHPLSKTATVLSGLAEERAILDSIKNIADFVINTTEYSSKQLIKRINDIFVDSEAVSSLAVSIVSFGFKYGIPSDSDLVFDVRFIPNPFYIEGMKHETGKNENVKEYVLKFEETETFIQKTVDMIDFLIPYYTREGKSQLIISIGCTGGRHRSVAISEKIFEIFTNKSQVVNIEHRDIEKDNRGV